MPVQFCKLTVLNVGVLTPLFGTQTFQLCNQGHKDKLTTQRLANIGPTCTHTDLSASKSYQQKFLLNRGSCRDKWNKLSWNNPRTKINSLNILGQGPNRVSQLYLNIGSVATLSRQRIIWNCTCVHWFPGYLAPGLVNLHYKIVLISWGEVIIAFICWTEGSNLNLP